MNFNDEGYDNLIVSAAIILLGLSILWMIIRKIRSVLRDSTGPSKSGRIMRKILFPVTSLLVLIALRINGELIFEDDEVLSVINKILTILIISSIAWISINAVGIIRVVMLRRYDLTQKDNLRARKISTQLRIIERIIIFIVIFVAVGAGLMTFEGIRKLGVSLFASAGIAGIILGLAAQKVIGSILAGFQIAITQPIRLDDVVIVEGEWGWIEEITLTYVVVRIWDKRRLIVPTSYFMDKPFENWTRVSADILGTVYVYTDYRMPVDKLREELPKILKDTNKWDGIVANVQVTNADDHSLELRILVSAADSPSAWELRVFVRERIIKFLQENYPDQLPRTRVIIPDELVMSSDKNQTE